MNAQFVRTIWKPARFLLLLVLALSWLGLTQITALGAPSAVPRAITNGGFENGDFTGWTKSTYDNGGLTGFPGPYTGGNITRNPGGTDLSIIVGSPTTPPLSQPDSVLGLTASLRWPFDGHYSARVNGVPPGGGHNGNRIVMSVATTAQDVRVSDGKIHVFLAYAPVLDNPNHQSNQQPFFYVALRNETKGTLLYEAFAFANGGGLPWQTITIGTEPYVYLNWQAIEVAPTAAALAAGDTISLSAEAAGCTPSGHPGWVYLDSFGTVAPTQTTVTTSPNPSMYGQAVTFTAHVTSLVGGTISTGTVQFYADGVAIGTPQTVSGGVATLAGITSLAPGSHTIVAVYSGDASWAGSTSPNYTHVVNQPNAPPAPAQPSEVPEADTLLLMGGGLGGLATWLRYQWSRRKKVH